MRQEPRLSVGIISAGAVGIALAEAFARAGHHVHGVYAHSERSKRRASERIPAIPQVSLESASHAALVVLAVPDPQLEEVVRRVAEHTRDGQIVAHVSGARGCAVLQPVTDTGALPLAMHPAMTFVGSPVDSENLAGCAWGVTSDSETGQAVAHMLVSSLGGVAIDVPEERRALYHAAMAHASNHLVTLLSDAQRIMDHALGGETAGREASERTTPENPDSASLLRSLVRASASGALDRRMEALTGPVARDDAQAVLRHLDALRALPEREFGQLETQYLQLAERTAQRVNSIEVERALGDRRAGLR